MQTNKGQKETVMCKDKRMTKEETCSFKTIVDYIHKKQSDWQRMDKLFQDKEHEKNSW